MDPTAFRMLFARNFHRCLDAAGAPSSGLGRTQYVADLFNIAKSSAGKWLSGATTPEPWRFEDIASVLGTTLDQLLGSDAMRPGCRSCPATLQANVSLDGGAHPICGALLTAVATEENVKSVAIVPPFPADYPNPNSLYVLRVESRVMEPYVLPGDFVAFVPTTGVTQEGEYVLWLQDRFAVRRISMGIDRTRLLLMADNKRYPTEEIDSAMLPACRPGGFSPTETSLQGRVVARILINR